MLGVRNPMLEYKTPNQELLRTLLVPIDGMLGTNEPAHEIMALFRPP